MRYTCRTVPACPTEKEVTMASQKQQYTILYGRLSQEDERAGESNSIQHQKDMLLRYAREHHFPNPTFFVDDGVSGVTYDHPGFQAMLAEIEAGRVAVCISKDLSRLGRNSALTGLYTNFTFPQLQRVFCFLASQHRQYAVISSWSGWRLACGLNV